ncbi:N-acetyltransferase [Ornithinibacillus bavariensis]|uniref:N-acetyltransferase n=2 Tax=Ornithinibacillus bavariensis TaxID=545502 RepID=A0A919XAU4_9BACI|nr:N-acetyltransferase [Ornithinibacillus bavariensis]
MSVEIKTSTDRPIKAIELMRLYRDVGWWENRNEHDIEQMLKREITVGAWEDDVLVGFARSISDGKFRAYVEDVVIQTEYQKLGIGKKLILQLLKELSHIDVISLFCEADLIPFYEKNQFKFSNSQVVMHRNASLTVMGNNE